MTKKSLSFKMGDGSIQHNFREYDDMGFQRHSNIDRSLTKNNIIIKKQDIKEFYDKEFAEAIATYNAKQKRKDRCINDGYYEHLFGTQTTKWVAKAKTGKYETKSFYEDVVQLGTMNDTAIGSADSVEAIKVLEEYARGFQARNPQLKQVNAVIHLDEKTPHLHNDWVPICDQGYKKGLSKQVALAKALEQQGIPISMHQISDWRIRERKVLEEICRVHGIEVKTTAEIDRPGDMPDMSPQQYKLWKENAKTIEEQKEEIATLNDKLEIILKEKEQAETSAKSWQRKSEESQNLVDKLQAIIESLGESIKQLFEKALPRFQKQYDTLDAQAMELRMNVEPTIDMVQNYHKAEADFKEAAKPVQLGLDRMRQLQKEFTSSTSSGSEHSINRDGKRTKDTSL